MMRVLINALSARQGGGQTYLINLLQHMPGEGEMEVFLLAPASLQLPEGINGVHHLHVRFPLESPFLRAIWERFRLPSMIRELGADIFFCPGGVVGAKAPGRCKTVTMFRNMLPFDLKQRRKYPLGYDRLRNWMLNRVMLRSMRAADLVIFISVCARNMIRDVAGLSLKNTVVIHHGINPRFRRREGGVLSRPSWLPPEEYLLYVSTLDVYKAQIEVIQAYAIMKKRRVTSVKLLLVGAENAWYGDMVRKEIKKLGLEHDVIVTGAIPYHDLPAVYHHALINIYASETENCPNILLEALAAGRPIVCSDREPMPEFGGEAVVYFNPSEPADLAKKLIALMKDPARREQLSRLACERSRRFVWQKSAELTWDAIVQVADANPK